MIHRAPERVPPLFARPPDPPRNSLTPGADGTPRIAPNYVRDVVRLPLLLPAHRNAPAGTSQAAADRIAGHAPKQRAEVLAVIVRAGAHGATDAEIEAATGIRAQSVSPRRGELRALGLVVESGRRRPTPSGRRAAVWVTLNHVPPMPKPEGGAA